MRYELLTKRSCKFGSHYLYPIIELVRCFLLALRTHQFFGDLLYFRNGLLMIDTDNLIFIVLHIILFELLIKLLLFPFFQWLLQEHNMEQEYISVQFLFFFSFIILSKNISITSFEDMFDDEENFMQAEADQQSVHNSVPPSNRARFFNEIHIRHKYRKRTQAKRFTHKAKIAQVRKPTYINLFANPIEKEEQQIQRKVTYIHGNKIEGTWKNGVLHGHVIIQYETGEHFQGNYINGIRVEGIVKFKDGTQYQGGFLKDIFHGVGTLKDPSGRIIKCQWQQGEPISKAKIQYPSGDIYFGEIKNLKKHGNGHLFFKNGSKYIGNFVNGAITGYGSFYENDQKVAEGMWVNGILEIEQNVKKVLLQAIKIEIGEKSLDLIDKKTFR